MKRYWFRQDGPCHWAPATWEGWLTMGVWVLVGPVLGAVPILFIRPVELGVFAMVGWTLLSTFALIPFVVNHADPNVND